MSHDKRGILHSDARQIIYDVIKFCEYEKLNGISVPLSQVTLRVAAMVGINKNTVTQIRKEGKEADEKGCKISTPKVNCRVPTNKIEIDDMDKCIIRRQFHNYYAVNKEIPTLGKLHNFCRNEIQFKGCKETLRKIVQSLGFEFKKCKDKRHMLIERNDILAKRAAYLRFMKKNDREEKRPVVYIDETWFHTHYTVHKCWQNVNMSGVYTNHSPGQRLIVVHAGGDNGFVPGAFLMYDGKSRGGDYHDEMNSINFTKWVTAQLIPGLPQGSIVVLDNAPYHSMIENKPPTSNANKTKLQNWLRENGINYDEGLRRSELLTLINQNRPKPNFQIDRLLREKGFIPLRLPPYHPDLNPIELIWNQAKYKIAERNMVNVSLTSLKTMVIEAFATITKDDWGKAIEHTRKICDDYWVRDGLIDEEVELMIISLGDDSSTDEINSGSEISDYDYTQNDESDEDTRTADSSADGEQCGSSTDTADETREFSKLVEGVQPLKY